MFHHIASRDLVLLASPGSQPAVDPVAYGPAVVLLQERDRHTLPVLVHIGHEEADAEPLLHGHDQLIPVVAVETPASNQVYAEAGGPREVHTHLGEGDGDVAPADQIVQKQRHDLTSLFEDLLLPRHQDVSYRPQLVIAVLLCKIELAGEIPDRHVCDCEGDECDS